MKSSVYTVYITCPLSLLSQTSFCIALLEKAGFAALMSFGIGCSAAAALQTFQLHFSLERHGLLLHLAFMFNLPELALLLHVCVSKQKLCCSCYFAFLLSNSGNKWCLSFLQFLASWQCNILFLLLFLTVSNTLHCSSAKGSRAFRCDHILLFSPCQVTRTRTYTGTWNHTGFLHCTWTQCRIIIKPVEGLEFWPCLFCRFNVDIGIILCVLCTFLLSVDNSCTLTFLPA